MEGVVLVTCDWLVHDFVPTFADVRLHTDESEWLSDTEILCSFLILYTTLTNDSKFHY